MFPYSLQQPEAPILSTSAHSFVPLQSPENFPKQQGGGDTGVFMSKIKRKVMSVSICITLPLSDSEIAGRFSGPLIA